MRDWPGLKQKLDTNLFLGNPVFLSDNVNDHLISSLGSPNLSDSEKTALQQLSGIGISQELLREDLGRGVRSPVIASYRILLHRAMLHPEERRGSGGSGGVTVHEGGGLEKKLNPAPIVGKVQNFQSPKAQKVQKSKACTIL